MQTAFEEITTNDTAEEHLLRLLYVVYLVTHLLIQLLGEPWMKEPQPDRRAHFTREELEQKVVEFNAWAFDVASRTLCHGNNKENTLACIGVLSALFLDRTYMRCTVICTA